MHERRRPGFEAERRPCGSVTEAALLFSLHCGQTTRVGGFPRRGPGLTGTWFTAAAPSGQYCGFGEKAIAAEENTDLTILFRS